jgi:hypothetical protein
MAVLPLAVLPRCLTGTGAVLAQLPRETVKASQP